MAWEHDNSIARLYCQKRQALMDGVDFIDLSMVNPDLSPPRIVVDRLLEAINQSGSHRYSSSRGIKKLREAFAERYARIFGVSLDAENQVCVTLGSKDGVLHALSAIMAIAPSSAPVVLVGAPTYPAYRFVADYLGVSLATFDITQNENDMLGDIDRLAQSIQAPALLLNFPNNPTGISVSRGFYKGLAEIIKARSLYVVNDFTYGEMVYDGNPAVSLLSDLMGDVSDRVVESYSLSKVFSVPGWRVGGLLGSSRIVGEVARLKSRVDFGVFLPIQVAAVSALQSESEVVQANTETYQRRYRFLRDELSKLGWSVPEVNAGCCLWAASPDGMKFHHNLAEDLLLAGVAALPGAAFGKTFENFVRFALVTSESQLREVVNRIATLGRADA
jgi:alanine-synthesizing transaminase